MTSIVKIFFHFGPGGNPEVDRELLSQRSKGSIGIDFWQQPLYDGSGDYIPNLIKRAQKKVEQELESGHQVELIGHSFGCFIINQLPQELLDQVTKVTYLAPTFNFFESLMSMMLYGINRHGETGLKPLWDEVKADPSGESFFGLFDAFLQFYPNFLSLYFKEEKSFTKFVNVAKDCSPVDEATQVKAAFELIENYNSPKLDLKRVKHLRLYLGEQDPLIPKSRQKDLEELVGAKNTIYLETGHFPHLETDITF